MKSTLKVSMYVDGQKITKELSGVWFPHGTIYKFVLDNYIILEENDYILLDEGDIMLGDQVHVRDLPISHSGYDQIEEQTVHGFYSEVQTTELKASE